MYIKVCLLIGFFGRMHTCSSLQKYFLKDCYVVLESWFQSLDINWKVFLDSPFTCIYMLNSVAVVIF
jgi:hypothetical protein